MATNPLQHLMPTCSGAKAAATGSVLAAGAQPTGDPLDGTVRLNEIFHSIQGESTWAGLPCVFVRLTGCPLVELTGGEPLAQRRAFDLIRALCDRGLTVLIETSGAVDIAPCDPRSIRILDVKTPGSGEAARNLWSNVADLRARDEVKFVVTDRADYDWAKARIAELGLDRRVREGSLGAILMSAAWEQPKGTEIAGCAGLPPRDLAAWIVADRLPVRMQTQLHKIIWDPRTRGV